MESRRITDKHNNAFNNSSVNDAITKMINPGDRLNIPCSVGLTPGGSVQWVQNGKPILLVSILSNLTNLCFTRVSESQPLWSVFKSLHCFSLNVIHINPYLTYRRITESLLCQFKVLSHNWRKTSSHFVWD